ncbi:MAG: PQQ-dependent sugar dehydrogenase [Acidimicrobiia bacterium]|nr:PQQ-dependent sugar dehydrogenase [Acidimicrobiia bacterium]
MISRLWLVVVGAALVAAACGDTAETIQVAPATTLNVALPSRPAQSTQELQGIALTAVAEGLDRPVAISSAAGDDRVFVVEQGGRVRIVRNGELVEPPFLKIESLVGSEELEQGMLDIAFHPEFMSNGRFFVSYTDVAGDSKVVEYSADPTSDVADLDVGRVILAIDQPHKWHNGGQLRFGPDGYLWISFGDGGGIEDMYGNGQRSDTLLGTLVRLDVNYRDPYSIPPDNPFLDEAGAPEVWAYGLRNPWRFAIDATDGLVYIADVGQATFEEIDVIPLDGGGANFGWPVFEGAECFVPQEVTDAGGSVQCIDSGFAAPILTYHHRRGCAIIGGPVYRGQEIPELWGHYLYGDWCRGWLKSFRYEDGEVIAEADWSDDVGELGPLLSIGADSQGEIYLGFGSGTIYRVEAAR